MCGTYSYVWDSFIYVRQIHLCEWCVCVGFIHMCGTYSCVTWLIHVCKTHSYTRVSFMCVSSIHICGNYSYVKWLIHVCETRTYVWVPFICEGLIHTCGSHSYLWDGFICESHWYVTWQRDCIYRVSNLIEQDQVSLSKYSGTRMIADVPTQIDWHLKIQNTDFVCIKFPPPLLSLLHSTRGHRDEVSLLIHIWTRLTDLSRRVALICDMTERLHSESERLDWARWSLSVMSHMNATQASLWMCRIHMWQDRETWSLYTRLIERVDLRRT